MAEKTEVKTIAEKLLYVQQKLKAPKDLFNKFGGYSYRSMESILQNVKPLLEEMGLSIVLEDDIVLVGERYYVKATATITDGKGYLSTHAYAREQAEKKGMDESQITGACSSYARKYALNGLLAIDDGKDADSMDNSKTPVKETREAPKPQPTLNVDDVLLAESKALKINLDNVAKYLKKSVGELTDEDIRKCIDQKKKALEARQAR